MADSLYLATESSCVEIMRSLYYAAIRLAQCESIEKALPVAKKIREIRKHLERFEAVRSNLTGPLLEVKELSVKTQPMKPVEQLYHVIRQVLVEIEQQLGGLLAEMKKHSSIEGMIPLAKLVSEIRKNVPQDPQDKPALPNRPISPPASTTSPTPSQPIPPPIARQPSSFKQSQSTLPTPTTNASLPISPRAPAMPPPSQPSGPSSPLASPRKAVDENPIPKPESSTLRANRRAPPSITPIEIPTSQRHEPDLCDSQLYSDPVEDLRPVSQISTMDRLPELRVVCSLSLDEVYGKLENLKGAFTTHLTMEDAVKNGRLLSTIRKDFDKMRVKIPVSRMSSASGGYLNAPENMPQHVKDLYKAADQVLTEIYERLTGLRSVVGMSTSIDEIVEITKFMRDMSHSLNTVSKGSLAPKLTNFSSGQITPRTARGKQNGFGANIPTTPKVTSSVVPAHMAEKYLAQFRTVAQQAVTEILGKIDFLKEHLLEIKSTKETIPLARLVGEVKKVLENFPGDTTQYTAQKPANMQDNFVRVIGTAIHDVSCRVLSLQKHMDETNVIEEAIILARVLNEVRLQIETYFGSYCQDRAPSQTDSARPTPPSTPKTDVVPPPTPKRVISPASPKEESMKQNLESIRKAVASVSLERIIADMRKCCSDVGEGLGKVNDEILPMDKRIAKLQGTIRKDQEEGRRAAEVEKIVHELQQEISALNIKRHVLTLAVRNLDRKINLLVRSQVKKSDEEDIDEVFQFFDESSQADHPLGNLKECYENFVYFLRQRPQYMTSLMQFIPHSELDNISQMVTVSLFSDIFLSREELILLNLIRSVMYKSFEDCSDMSNYLRSNSFITKVLAGYAKRQGGRLHLMEIFKSTLTDILIDEKTNFELDIPKVRAEVESTFPKGTPSALIDDETQKVLKTRTLQLQESCANLLKNIISNLRNMPYGMRWLCKEMVRLAKLKFKDMVPRDELILVGSYIFLRYLMPAVITPEGHGIITNISITARRRRNLILCGKVLQNLANDVEFGGKEQYMSVMNQFMVESRSIIFDYFKALTNVVEPEEYYHTVIDSGSTTSAIHQSVTITPNELLTVHRLIVDNHTEIIKESDDPMMLLLMKMGPPIENLPRKKNKYIVLEVLNYERELVSGPSSTFMKQLKERLTTVLQSAPTINPIASQNPSIVQILESIRKFVDPSVIIHIDYLVGKLSNIPDERRANLENDIVTELEKELHSRRMYRESLAKERQELSAALDNQKNLVDQKSSEKSIYTDYMLNIQKRAFQQKVKGNGDKIGPFVFNVKELEKMKLLVPSPLLETLRNALTVEMASTKPGTVHFTTHMKGDSRVFVLDISQLMDELIMKDTVEYEGVIFDLRRLISFLHTKFIG